MRPRLVLTSVVVLAWLGITVQACTDLSVVVPGQCGNRVVEASVGEECDTVAQDGSDDADKPSHCGEVGTASECRYVWSEEYSCPRGWRAGADQRCRRASGAFQSADGSLRQLVGSRVQVGDHDGDGQLDVMLDAPDGQSTKPFYLSRGEAGFTAEAAPAASAEAALADVTADGVADVITTVDIDGDFPTDGEPAAGIVVRKGNLARVDDLRVYPGPTRFASKLIYFWSPSDSPDGDFDDLNAVYEGEKGPPCPAPLCIRGEYNAAPKPMPSFQAASLEQILDSTVASGRELSIVAPLHGHELLVVSPFVEPFVVPLNPGSERVMGVAVRDLDGDGDEDVGLFKELAGDERTCAIGFDVIRGPVADWSDPPVVERLSSFAFPFAFACDDLTDKSFAFVNDDEVPDIVLSGVTASVSLSNAPFEGGNLEDTHTMNAMEGWTLHSVGDLNGDGRDDIAAASSQLQGGSPVSYGIDVVLGGDLSPLVQARIVTSRPVRALVVTDLDGDGLGDIVVALGDLDEDACEVPNDLMVAYGRSYALPDDFTPIGGFPGVEHLSAGRFRGPKDSISDVAVLGRCNGPDGLASQVTILRGDVARRPYAPLILDLDPMTPGYFQPLRVFSANPDELVSGRASLVVTSLAFGSGGYTRAATLLTPNGNADLTTNQPLELPLPDEPELDIAPQSFLVSPSRAGQFLLGSFVSDAMNGSPGLRLDSYSVGETIQHLGEASFYAADSFVFPTWSMAAIAAPEATALGVVTSLTNVEGMKIGAPLFWLAPWNDDGSFGEFFQVDSPDETGFVAIDTVAAEFQSEGGSRDLSEVFYVATELAVYRLGCDSGRLPECDGAPIAFEPLRDGLGQPLSLGIGKLTGLARGDFTQDGLDDLIVLGQQGARVVEQLALCAADLPAGACLYD